jgi:hypothetical protein
MTDTTDNTENTALVANPDTKTIVSKHKNALVHGVYTVDTILPWESEEEFEHLFQDLRTEWTPEGRTEEEAILTLARALWNKHRLMRSTQMVYRKDPLVGELIKSGAKTWAEIEGFLQDKANADDSVMDEVKRTLNQLRVAAEAASALMTASNPDTQKIYRAVKGIEELYLKSVIPVYGKVYDASNSADVTKVTPNNAIEQAYHPDCLEKLIRLDASIDTRVDKALARIINLKEYKRIARQSAPKQIASQSIVPA